MIGKSINLEISSNEKKILARSLNKHATTTWHIARVMRSYQSEKFNINLGRKFCRNQNYTQTKHYYASIETKEYPRDYKYQIKHFVYYSSLLKYENETEKRPSTCFLHNCYTGRNPQYTSTREY